MSDPRAAGRATGPLARAALVGTLATAASFAYAGPTTDFVAAPVYGVVVAGTPSAVIAVAILVLGKGGEALAFAVALALSVALLGLVGVGAARLGRRLDAPQPLVAYLLGWAAAAAVLRAPFHAIPPAVAMAATVWGMARFGGGGRRAVTGRRAVLLATGVAVAGTALATAVGLRRERLDASALSAIPNAERRTVDRRVEAARATDLGVAGLESPVTRVGDFFEVDINVIDPDVNAADWALRVTGAVDRELTLGYGELTAMATAHRFNTLRCVGEPLNGRLMDTALWTGVPTAALLERAGPASDCGCVRLHAVDGYDEEFPLPALERGLLAYGMNGRLLPRDHGFPLRALVPGHWGEVNVKWLTGIEVLEREAVGYWERRGWHGTGPVTTVAKLHAENRLDDGRLQVAGHAYAGLRGVDRVEVSVDGGETWAAARLSAPLPDPDSWRQWAYEWRPTADTHEVVVRAVDGTGATQSREEQSPFPRGASGWVSRTVEA